MSQARIPSGWYFCAESTELAPGQVIAKQLCGQSLVLWRSAAGVARLSTSVCPHLGSDLGKLGRVVGEHLQCFSHRYTYDGDGDCVATGFQTLPCRHKRVLRQLPVQESQGFILFWYDAAGQAPGWRIPDAVFDPAGTTGRQVRSDFTFQVSTEILNEDNFDVGHLYQWHQVTDVRTEPVRVDGPTISIAHHFRRHSILFGKPLPGPLRVLSRPIVSRYSSTLYGHGLTASFIDIFNLGVHLQDLIFVTPLGPQRIQYTTFVRRMRPRGARGRLRRLSDLLIQPLIFAFSVWRLRQEHRHEGQGFWENQSRVDEPILTAPERALIEPYRQWCRQFDPDQAPARLAATA